MIATPPRPGPSTLASGELAVPSAARRGEASRVLPIMPITMPPIIAAAAAAAHRVRAADLLEVLRHREGRCRTSRNETSVDSVVPR